jgi:hypothetical protein
MGSFLDGGEQPPEQATGFQINEATMTNAASNLVIDNGQIPDWQNQVVHPDFCRPNPAGKWNGYTYWMVFEPYPFGHSEVENPFIQVSDDLETWIAPPGLTNPIAPAPASPLYNSDGDIFYDAADDKLYVIYRESDGATVDRIFVRSSADGVTWSAATQIIPDAEENTIVSPALVYNGSYYELFCINGQSGHVQRVEYRASPAITGPWTAPTILFSATPASDPAVMWHLDVNYDATGKYLALISLPGDCRYLYLASSLHGHKWWYVADEPVMYKSVSGWDNNGFYRSSIGVRTGTGYEVLYSGRSTEVSIPGWKFGHTQLTIPVA